jgi:hypothetical protein
VLDHAGELWQSWPIGTRGIFFIFFPYFDGFSLPSNWLCPKLSETPRHQLTNPTLDNRSISCQASLAVVAHTRKCRWAVPRAAKLPKHLARAASEVV